ncbi:hypothetical protein SKAU_G00387470 [Synaphobranchus kaupii]|uniref:Zinc finger CCHC domain-containing protein n=1 Tax=Synaphobranchus kaupii TaxID=118154 RepID=A0A9Q1EAX9_SYNKA|nr:hypothetical protein SKAU_G00387470 [Synaphobranchus kaupii]
MEIDYGEGEWFLGTLEKAILAETREELEKEISAAELGDALRTAIWVDNRIRGLRLPGGGGRVVKLAQYADDTTLLLESKDFFERRRFNREVLLRFFGIKVPEIMCVQRNRPQRFFDVTLRTEAHYKKVEETGRVKPEAPERACGGATSTSGLNR